MSSRVHRGKGMRKSYLKSYSAAFVNTGRTPNPMYMDEWYARQKSGASDPMESGPGTFTATQEKLWQGVRFQGIDRFQKILVLRGRTMLRWMYFSGRQFFFIEQDLTIKMEKRSIVYRDRDYAMQQSRRDNLVWVMPPVRMKT